MPKKNISPIPQPVQTTIEAPQIEAPQIEAPQTEAPLTEAPLTEAPPPVKSKRGRKSKKELLENLLINKINFNNSQTIATPIDAEDNTIKTNDSEQQIIMTFTELSLNESVNDPNMNEQSVANNTPVAKKRGRKPKGGKIIQQLAFTAPQPEVKANVILHLKCSLKDLQQPQLCQLEGYNFGHNNNSNNYNLIGSENINNVTVYDTGTIVTDDVGTENYNDEATSSNREDQKDLTKKLKQLEYNLHTNYVNKRSACFWDTCDFDNPPIYIPKSVVNGTYNVYGCFCSPECAAAHLMHEAIDTSTKFERYHLFNNIYSKIYEYNKNIKPAPNPYYMLDKYYGNLSIQEYRSLLRNERLFLIIDKPLTKILPELHEDNDDFILNNKIIPSNKYLVKSKITQNKATILNEKFGITA